MKLTNKEIERYGRHLLLPEIGEEGQLKLKNAKVLIVGVGGLGSPVAIYLATAGVGTLGLIDFDKVELSNLHRQVIHFTDDIGKQKVISAKEKISQLNPEVKTVIYETRFSADNALKVIKDFDLVIDGSDNFPTRYLINDACVLSGKPYVFGGIFRFEGQCSVFGLSDGPCYRCFFEEPPKPGEVPSCAEAGVIGVLPGIIGILQAQEAIKFICGIGEPLKGRLLMFDGLSTSFREIKIKKNFNCAICGPKRTIHKLTEAKGACEVNLNIDVPEITVQELKKKLDKNAKSVYLIDVREQEEWDIVHIPGARLKPISNFENNYADIPKDTTVYFHCGGGGRSKRAIKFLKDKGYTNELVNVKGGVNAWAKEIDPKMPRY